VAKALIFAGIVFIAVGLIVFAAQRLGIGRLPGDIVIQRNGFTLYLPITTSILVSLVLTLVLWLTGR
jgi:hypothetical protein